MIAVNLHQVLIAFSTVERKDGRIYSDNVSVNSRLYLPFGESVFALPIEGVNLKFISHLLIANARKYNFQSSLNFPQIIMYI